MLDSCFRRNDVPYPVPCTPYPVPCTLYPVPRTLYPVPCTPYPVPRTFLLHRVVDQSCLLDLVLLCRASGRTCGGRAADVAQTLC